ncbi:MAG: glycoside hydrolase [Flavobacteriaceae bacterium]|nr:glycoside hydrolase [Flavobacteriaceae bacterium]|tara:strand:- start:5183 stop:6982 length:1800 start_codon:yes stop_codon:yes gene_type:complete
MCPKYDFKKPNLNYGIVGNCRSAALINYDASIDWCCLPNFDSPSVFANILDDEIGGHFKILCHKTYNITQKYSENTCILITTFSNNHDEFEIIDFMPRYQKESGVFYSPPEIIRIFKLLKGEPRFKIVYDPRLEYSNGITNNYIKERFIVSVIDQENHDTLYLYTSFNKKKFLNGTELILNKDHFVNISYHEKIKPFEINDSLFEFDKTKVYWRNWCSKTPTFKLYNYEIIRSAITLKLLTYEKTGAVLAAATTSIPETIGEVRNWDYRFCWIRDSSMVIKVVAKLGHKKIVKDYIKYILNLIPEKNEKLQIMYGINGEKNLKEKTLDYLKGYMGSKPVRIGNAAYIQKQNDMYGILMDAIHFQIIKFDDDDKHQELWSIVKSIVWVVANNWKLPDKGIWEYRNEDRHFTFSKVLCWVAIDRAIKVSKLIQNGISAQKWEPLRKEIFEDIIKNAWNEKKEAFTQSYNSEHLDASVLLMEPYGFLDSKNEKYIKTVKAIEKDLLKDGLMYRYKNVDDFGLPTSSFTVCSFWLIDSLFKIGEEKKAIKLFDNLLKFSNHLNLFSEDIDFKSKRMLGNFPQAYSHLALIDTALNFNLKLDSK